MRTARTFRERLRGLAFAAPGEPLLIPRCSSVHTFGMCHPLDIYWLDADHDLLRIDVAVPPRRIRRHRRASAVLEVASASRPSRPGGGA